MFPLWCWYVRHACQRNASAGPGRRGGRAESWTCSATRPKARRPPFTALRRTTWMGFCLTIAQAHPSTDRPRRNVKQLLAWVCCLFFLFLFFLQQHAKRIYNFRHYVNFRNCFRTDESQPFINEGMLFLSLAASVYREVLVSGQRSHFFWTVMGNLQGRYRRVDTERRVR